ncbi:oxidoreductase, molybdopterin binding protein [Citreicella sp. 357]|nr:oxidoreductase, molybdopterin binding protein [Citreicella sp. 357]
MAFSDYIVDIPLTGGTDAGPITAYRHNGSLMAVRDGGPLWIVCPYDSRAAYQTEQISSRRIWQLGRIVVVE